MKRLITLILILMTIITTIVNAGPFEAPGSGQTFIAFAIFNLCFLPMMLIKGWQHVGPIALGQVPLVVLTCLLIWRILWKKQAGTGWILAGIVLSYIGSTILTNIFGIAMYLTGR